MAKTEPKPTNNAETLFEKALAAEARGSSVLAAKYLDLAVKAEAVERSQQASAN